MDLTGALRGINTNVVERPRNQSKSIDLPVGDLQKLIAEVLPLGIRNNELMSGIGKLTACYAISFDALEENADFIFSRCSPESGSLTSVEAVAEIIRKKSKEWKDQVGIYSDDFLTGFSYKVYSNLPEDLRSVLHLVDDPDKKAVLLMSLIVALSAAYSRWRFNHGADGDNKEYSPHILALGIGSSGSGKGIMRYASEITAPIESEAQRKKQADKENYFKAVLEYKRELRRREKEKLSYDGVQAPEPYIRYAFHISASDTTQAALVETLKNNPQGGLATESEVDTMTQANSKEFGGFGDVLRKVPHHEPLKRQRKGDGESYIVYNPRLAIIMTGTKDQVKKLIHDEQNGLFNRFWFYNIKDKKVEYRPPGNQQDVIGEVVKELSHQVHQRADLWSDELYFVQFSESQEKELADIMNSDMHEVQKKYGGDVSACWIRMGLLAKRIAVTLSAHQGSTELVLPNAWRVAMELIPDIKKHCLKTLELIRENNGYKQIDAKLYDELLAEGKTQAEIASELGVSRPTLNKWKERNCKNVKK